MDYVFRPLTNSREIRVFELFPGCYSDHIDGRLLHVALGDADYIHYDAVSYLWGDHSHGAILVEHKHYAVTSSVMSLLRDLRLLERSRFLWIDQICINQTDFAEKNCQVSIMADIFSRADTVRVWLDIQVDPNDPALVKLASFNGESVSEDLGTVFYIGKQNVFRRY